MIAARWAKRRGFKATRSENLVPNAITTSASSMALLAAIVPCIPIKPRFFGSSQSMTPAAIMV